MSRKKLFIIGLILTACTLVVYFSWSIFLYNFFDDVKDFDRQSIALHKEIDNWPPMTQWKPYTDKDFNITLSYPPTEWSVSKHIGTSPEDKTALRVNWHIYAGNQIEITPYVRDNREIKTQIIDLLEKHNRTVDPEKIKFLRDDFVEIYEPSIQEKVVQNAGKRLPINFLIQKDTIYIITYRNYGDWTTTGRSAKFINALNLGLLKVAHTIKTAEN